MVIKDGLGKTFPRLQHTFCNNKMVQKTFSCIALLLRRNLHKSVEQTKVFVTITIYSFCLLLSLFLLLILLLLLSSLPILLVYLL